MFIIRRQGFFYTDEYYAQSEVFRRDSKKTFATKQEADKACAALIREWIRSEPIGNYLFDETDAIGAVLEYMQAEWPDDDIEWTPELEIPEDATDKQVDEIVKCMDVTFAQVFEVDSTRDDHNPGLDEELHYGPS